MWLEACFEDVFYGMIDAMKKFHNTNCDLGHQTNAFEQTWQMIRMAREGLSPMIWTAEWLLHRIEKLHTDGMVMQLATTIPIINFMQRKTKDVKMVDFEYATMNDISYDLAIFSQMSSRGASRYGNHQALLWRVG
jgi:hypothetical protein